MAHLLGAVAVRRLQPTAVDQVSIYENQRATGRLDYATASEAEREVARYRARKAYQRPPAGEELDMLVAAFDGLSAGGAGYWSRTPTALSAPEDRSA